MKGNGNGIRTLLRKLYFMIIPTSGARSNYIRRNRHLFRHVGDKLFFQPRTFPADPELIYFGNNVKVASDVLFINHDITNSMLCACVKGLKISEMGGGIFIGDNVMIGARSIIMPDVRIGNNVVIAAGSIVTKDIPDNCVAGGIPAKIISTFDALVEKRRTATTFASDGAEKIWKDFHEKRK